MIQLQFDTIGIIVLEPENLERIKNGEFLQVPIEHFKGPALNRLIIDFTPDVNWCRVELEKLLLESGGHPHPLKIQQIIRESRSRPEVKSAQAGTTDLIAATQPKGRA